jgi:NADH-quinone oxidoreductase subunit E
MTASATPAKPVLSAESVRRIDREVAKYPADRKQSAVMSALAVAQDQHGWLPTAAMDAVAEYLGMPAVAVYEVATFYAMYNLAPTGRFKITVCTNLPCALSGGEAAAEHLKQRLAIGFNETTADGLFTLKEGECMGACGDAPVLLVNNKRMCSFMVDAKLDELVSELSAAAGDAAGAMGAPPDAAGQGAPGGGQP